MSIQAALTRTKPLILDGGLATELERRGHRLTDALWSARLLLDAPESIEDVHRDYYAAGAECVTTASYQASYHGFAATGIDRDQATALLRRSVHLASSARSRFTKEPAAAGVAADHLFVAASIGPYGATLHDGSEYRGDYALSERELATFHGPRLAVLADAGADVMACETIPLLREALAITQVLSDVASMPAWVSFTSLDGAHTAGGDSLTKCARALDSNPQVVAVGVNCLSPTLVSSCLRQLRRGTSKPLVAYPNIAGTWNAASQRWTSPHAFAEVTDRLTEWTSLGAAALGGCCGTTPADIEVLARVVRSG